MPRRPRMSAPVTDTVAMAAARSLASTAAALARPSLTIAKAAPEALPAPFRR